MLSDDKPLNKHAFWSCKTKYQCISDVFGLHHPWLAVGIVSFSVFVEIALKPSGVKAGNFDLYLLMSL